MQGGNKRKTTELIGDGLASNRSPTKCEKKAYHPLQQKPGEKEEWSVRGVLDGRKQTAMAWGSAGDVSISARSKRALQGTGTRRSQGSYRCAQHGDHTQIPRRNIARVTFHRTWVCSVMGGRRRERDFPFYFVFLLSKPFKRWFE